MFAARPAELLGAVVLEASPEVELAPLAEVSRPVEIDQSALGDARFNIPHGPRPARPLAGDAQVEGLLGRARVLDLEFATVKPPGQQKVADWGVFKSHGKGRTGAVCYVDPKGKGKSKGKGKCYVGKPKAIAALTAKVSA